LGSLTRHLLMREAKCTSSRWSTCWLTTAKLRSTAD
jgi:hypothetical protein